MEVIIVWKPVYWLAAAVKIVTASASAGTAAVLLVSADDIADFVRTPRAAAARRGSQQYRALVESAPIAVVSADLDANITALNPASDRMFRGSAVPLNPNHAPLVTAEKTAQL